MHLHKFYLTTFIADIIILSDCALLVVPPPKTHFNIKRKNVEWKNGNFDTSSYMPGLETEQTTLKPSYKVKLNEEEFHFIRHFRHKRRKELEKERVDEHLKQSPFVKSEQKSGVNLAIKDSNKRPTRRKTIQNKSLLQSLLS